MGGKCCKNDTYRTEMLSEIQNFNFNDQESEFPLEQRAIREIMLDTKTIYQLQICLKKFLLENAYKIKEEGIEIKGNGITAKIQPPPLLDLVWQMAILYSHSYAKICRKLVGCIIDREYSQDNMHKTILKKMLPDYDDNLYSVEYEYTVWIRSSELESIMTDLYSNILGEDSISFEFILQLMMQIKLDLCKTISKREVKFNGDQRVKKAQEYILKCLPSELELILMHKYCLNQPSAIMYLIEYSHFMAMLKFTNQVLVPSEEVDQVWHTHLCMTKQYRQFCFVIFDRFIYHYPSNQAKQQTIQDSYTSTLEFYRKTFDYPPHPQIWPSKEERWNPQNYLGSWVNLFRLCMSIISVIQEKMIPNSSNILHQYQKWKGRNIFKGNTEITLDKSTDMQFTQQHEIKSVDVGCYCINELQENQFMADVKMDGLFFNDDVINNSIN